MVSRYSGDPPHHHSCTPFISIHIGHLKPTSRNCFYYCLMSGRQWAHDDMTYHLTCLQKQRKTTELQILGGGLNSRHLPKTHATTAGTQKNRISRHRQNSHHQQRITLCTAHSAHPLTSPNLNKTKRTVL